MAELVTVEGEALHTGFTNQPNDFSINLSGINSSKLAVDFQGPEKPQVMLAKDKDGNMRCTYNTKVAGEYNMSVTYDDDHIEGSPFKVVVMAK